MIFNRGELLAGTGHANLTNHFNAKIKVKFEYGDFGHEKIQCFE